MSVCTFFIFYFHSVEEGHAIGELGGNRCIKTASRETSLLVLKCEIETAPSSSYRQIISMATFDELSDPAICYHFLSR